MELFDFPKTEQSCWILYNTFTSEHKLLVIYFCQFLYLRAYPAFPRLVIIHMYISILRIGGTRVILEAYRATMMTLERFDNNRDTLLK